METVKVYAAFVLTVLACVLAGCSMQRTGDLDRNAPFPDLRPGSDAEPLTNSILTHPPFAIACKGVTFFAGDDGYRRCSASPDFTAIYRVGSQQYAYTVNGGTIVKTHQANHTITYP